MTQLYMEKVPHASQENFILSSAVLITIVQNTEKTSAV